MFSPSNSKEQPKWQSSALKLDKVLGPFLLDFCHYRVKKMLKEHPVTRNVHYMNPGREHEAGICEL